MNKNIKHLQKGHDVKKIEPRTYLWLLPAFALIFFFIILPSAETVFISLHKKQNTSVKSLKDAIIKAIERTGGVKPSGRSRLDKCGQYGTAIEEICSGLQIDPAAAGISGENTVQEAAEIIAAAAESGGGKKSAFAPVENYKETFSDPQTVAALKNNLLWIVLFTFATVAGGLVLAALFETVRWSAAARTLVFMPMALSFVAAGIIWAFIFDHNPTIGTVNALMRSAHAIIYGAGAAYEAKAFLADPQTVNYALIIAGIWMWTGFCVVIFTAALRAVPRKIIEAAVIDGANPLQIFFHIKIPAIRPALMLVSTTMLINVLKIFDIVYSVTGGGPFGSSEVLATRMYRSAFIEGSYEQASAIAVVLLLATVPLAIINCRGGITAE